MERTLFDWQHDYRATPSEYPIEDNNRPATYDQFITLRDTLIFSNKYYADKAGRSLIIGTKLDWTPTDTIEIREPNLARMSFEPWYEDHPDDENYIKNESKWTYVTSGSDMTNNPLSCTINKDGRYKIAHKEQFIQMDSDITRVLSYVMQNQRHEEVVNWDVVVSYTQIPRAVFDWEWDEWWFFKRMTTWWYVECDLKKWDWLELIMLDQDWNHIDSSTWKLQAISNRWCVEYIDLAYNK